MIFTEKKVFAGVLTIFEENVRASHELKRQRMHSFVMIRIRVSDLRSLGSQHIVTDEFLSLWKRIDDLDHPKGIHPDNLGNTYWQTKLIQGTFLCLLCWSPILYLEFFLYQANVSLTLKVPRVANINFLLTLNISRSSRVKVMRIT